MALTLISRASTAAPSLVIHICKARIICLPFTHTPCCRENGGRVFNLPWLWRLEQHRDGGFCDWGSMKDIPLSHKCYKKPPSYTASPGHSVLMLHYLHACKRAAILKGQQAIIIIPNADASGSHSHDSWIKYEQEEYIVTNAKQKQCSVHAKIQTNSVILF